jgi:hypothetical protein
MKATLEVHEEFFIFTSGDTQRRNLIAPLTPTIVNPSNDLGYCHLALKLGKPLAPSRATHIPFTDGRLRKAVDANARDKKGLVSDIVTVERSNYSIVIEV